MAWTPKSGVEKILGEKYHKGKSTKELMDEEMDDDMDMKVDY